MNALPHISVIVPVHNSEKTIRACIEALSRQDYPSESYEILVIDNGSTDNTGVVVKSFADASGDKCSVRMIEEPSRGSYRARNTGIKQAKGEILAFTDADCIPADNWLSTGVKYVAGNPGCGLVSGRIEVFPRDPARPTAAELFDKLTAFPQKEFIERWHFGATGNLFAPKGVFNKVGDFNASLSSGGDLDWGRRVYEAGYGQLYADDLVVMHPARRKLEAISRKQIRIAGGISRSCKGGKYSFKSFLVDLKDDWPRIGDIFSVFRDKRLSGSVPKLKVFVTMLFVKFLRIFERTRIYLGGEPRNI